MGCGLTFEHNGYALDETVIKTDGVLQCTLSGSLCWNGNCISIPWPWVRLVVDVKSSYWQFRTPHSSSHTPFLHNLTIIRTEFKCWAEYIFILQIHNWNETQLCLLLCYLHVVSLAIALFSNSLVRLAHAEEPLLKQSDRQPERSHRYLFIG